MTNQLKAPFTYFGGKANAAPLVWDALGDVGGYVEPFAGSAAVLLGRPAFAGRRVETLNDADGWLVNTWRAIQLSPAEVAKHAAGPVTEIDLHARLGWLHERRDDDLISWLEGHPEAHDAKAAAWWLYVAAAGIGDPWGAGPWRVVEDRFVNVGTGSGGVIRQLPNLGSAGVGIHRTEFAGLEAPLANYMTRLADRLKAVRITAGDWRRVLTPSASRATASKSQVGIFLDPPYATSGDLYAITNTGEEHKTISTEVREWCLSAPEEFRIVLAGYDTEHEELERHGWTVIQGKSGSGPGYSSNPDNGKRERLWLSPNCVTAQSSLFEGF